MAMKLIRKATPQTMLGNKNAPRSICLIQWRPPKRAYIDPPAYPLTGEQAAYTKMAADRSDPRLKLLDFEASKVLCLLIFSNFAQKQLFKAFHHLQRYSKKNHLDNY